MEITTCVTCKNRCEVCPQSAFVRAYPGPKNDMMSMETFRTILSKLPAETVISFTGFSEPLGNPLLCDMIQLAARTRTVVVSTTLVDATDEQVDVLASMAVKHIHLHLPDMEGVCVWPVTPFYKYRLYRLLQERHQANLPTNAVCLGRSARPHRELMDVLSENYPSGIVSRCGLVDGLPVEHVEDPWCSKTGGDYDRNVVLPNGDVHLCCMDFGLTAKIGNLLTDRYEDLKFGPAEICSRCEWAENRKSLDNAAQDAKVAELVEGFRT
jgi:hypothetical protein